MVWIIRLQREPVPMYLDAEYLPTCHQYNAGQFDDRRVACRNVAVLRAGGWEDIRLVRLVKKGGSQ